MFSGRPGSPARWRALLGVLGWAVAGGLAAGSPVGRVPPGAVQDFATLAPADVRAGPIVLRGQVVHRALDGAWIKLKAVSQRGDFTYHATLLGLTPGGLPASTDAVAGSDLAWSEVRAGGKPALWLEGTVDSIGREGGELEGRFAFKGETARLRLSLVESHPLGADPAPTLRDVSYGPDVRQRMDVYLASSSQPMPVAVFIHGGAWQHGDKDALRGQHVFLDAGISVIAINYRYIPAENPSATVPAVDVPLRDAARAIQFIRSQAGEWGLMKDRLGVWGLSAGACTSLWLGTHPDLADPGSSDPVGRESTRPSCVAALFAQTSLDPAQMREWVGPELNYGAHAFGIRAGPGGSNRFEAFLAGRERLQPWIREYSPAALLTAGSAPVFLDYLDFSLEPCEPLGSYYTHSPRFGLGFLAAARQAGAECHLRHAGREDETYSGWQDFLLRQLRPDHPL